MDQLELAIAQGNSTQIKSVKPQRKESKITFWNVAKYGKEGKEKIQSRVDNIIIKMSLERKVKV